MSSCLYQQQIHNPYTMYTLNNTAPPIQTCTVCSTLLQSIGSQPYCPSCEMIVNNGVVLQKQMKVVPNMYIGNAGKNSNAITTQKNKRMECYLLEYANLYTGISTLDQLQHLISILTRMHMHSGKPSRHLRQSAAAIIYHQFKSIHKQSLREFCQKCMLKQRIVGDKYRLYYKLYGIRDSSNTYSIIKKEQRQEAKIQENPIYQESSQEIQKEQPQAQQQIRHPQKTIRLIFDDVFPKFYFLSKREMLISHLVRKIHQIAPLLSHHSMPVHPYPLLPYILYAILKHSCHKISIKRYIQIVEMRTGYKIRGKMLGRVCTWYAEHVVGVQSEEGEQRPTEQQQGVKQQQRQQQQEQSQQESINEST